MARARPDRERARQQKVGAAGLIDPRAVTEIGKLLGRPLTMPKAHEETSAERILLLTRRLQEIERPKPLNIYQSSFSRFLFELCWTADEARGGRVARVPEFPYLYEVADALILCDLLLFSKSRRVLASWVVCCFDLWIAAGGQDPRWPELLLGDSNRQVFVGDRKFDSAARFLKRRHQFILNEFKKHDGWEYWPEFPTWETREGEIEFANNSLITAVAQGSDQLRGPGATFAHLEEIAFWEQAQQTVEGLLPIIQGGGHVAGVTTPNSASYAKRIVEGKVNLQRSYR